MILLLTSMRATADHFSSFMGQSKFRNDREFSGDPKL
jgi:hypothetical protein